ncbi:MAG: PP2C family protein-serine/threonine phosphatase [Chloroflexi bacterium]|nr:PP2C family protein-serine/threonine phosphatase [Chloroflexota bacterium]
MVLNSQGRKQLLEPTGPAVGARPDVDYTLREVQLEDGDTLFAYTDGLTDAVNPAGETFEARGLPPLLGGDRALSALLEHIQNQIEEFSAGASQFDDITMLAVRRKAAE